MQEALYTLKQMFEMFDFWISIIPLKWFEDSIDQI